VPIIVIALHCIALLCLQIRDQKYGEAVQSLTNIVQTYSKVSVTGNDCRHCVCPKKYDTAFACHNFDER